MKSEQEKIAIKEADAFMYYCKMNHFVNFANKINKSIPAEDFSQFYI